METTFLKVLTASQKDAVEDMFEELVALQAKLQAFRETHGDHSGLVEQAASYAGGAASELHELVERAQPSRRRFGK